MSGQAIDTAVGVGLEVSPEPAGPGASLQRRPWLGILRNALRLGRTKIGTAIVLLLIAIALFGPLVAPYSPTEFIGVPNSAPSSDALFGTDSLGRDVWSRFLNGGRSVLWMSAAATLLGVGVGVMIGLVAAYSRNWVDDVLMRASDVVLAFPQIILGLLAVVGARAEAVADRHRRRGRAHAARRARDTRQRRRRSSSATSSRPPRPSARSARGSCSASCCRT